MLLIRSSLSLVAATLTSAFDLAEPSVPAGFLESLLEVGRDLFEPLPLARVGPEHRAADAGSGNTGRRRGGCGRPADDERGCELFERMRTPVLFCVVPFRGVLDRRVLSVPFCVFGG